MSYCLECGSELVKKKHHTDGIVDYCPSCKHFRFPLYNVAVNMIILDGKK